MKKSKEKPAATLIYGGFELPGKVVQYQQETVPAVVGDKPVGRLHKISVLMVDLDEPK